MATVQTGITTLELIENLPSKGVLSSTDLFLLQSTVQSFKVSYSDLVNNLPDNVTLEVNATTKKLQVKTNYLENVYPIGSIYMNATDSTNPNTLFGFGTWTKFGEGRVLISQKSSDSDFVTAEQTGGQKTHTLTKDEIDHHHGWGVYTNVNGNPLGSNNDIRIIGENWNDGLTYSLTDWVPGDGVNTYRDQNSPIDGSPYGVITSKVDTSLTPTGHNNLQPYIVVYMWKRVS